MPTNSRKYRQPPTPVEGREGIKISQAALDAYAKHDHSKDDSENPVLPPERWAKSMSRDEFFRPVKKLTSVRIDADVLAWLRSKGEGHLSWINEILRERMIEENPR